MTGEVIQGAVGRIGRHRTALAAGGILAFAALAVIASILLHREGRGDSGATRTTGTVTVPAISEESIAPLSFLWLQPRNSPAGRGVWGPDISAPFDTLWAVSTDLEFFAAPAYSEGVLYFGGNDGRFRAVDAESGRELWGRATACGLSSEAALDSTRVYFGGQDGYLYALERGSGSLAWSAGLGYSLFAGVGILDDSLVVTGNSEGSVAALGAADGEVVWHDSPGGVILGPAISDTTVVFTTESGVVCAYGISGRRLWMRDFQGTASPPSIASGAVFAGFSDGVVRRLDLADGSIAWERDLAPTPGRVSMSRPVPAGDLLLAGTCDSRVVCLSADDGSTVWEVSLENWVQVPPAVGDSTVYVSCDDQRFHVLDLHGGTELCVLEMGGYSGSAPLVVNGVVYIGTAAGDFFAYRGTPRPRENR